MSSLNPSLRAFLAPFSLILGGALLVSGCGGGGSGGGPTTPTSTPIPGVTPTPTATPLPGVVFSDEFDAGRLDSGKWTVLDRSNTLQRTEFGNQPVFSQDGDGTRFMRLKLDTFLPDGGAKAGGLVELFGTQVVANSKIDRGNGVEFQAKMRMTNPNQPGLVGAFFLFGQKGNFGGTPPLSFDEIDHELLTNAFVANPPYTWTNIYNDFRVPQPGLPTGDRYDDLTKNDGQPRPIQSGFDKGGWNVYRIVWKPGQVQWFINGSDQPIATDTTGRVPDDALGVRFNLWAAAAPPIGWADAYSAALQAASTPGANQTFSLDVDWVRVRSLGATTSDARSKASSRLIPMTRQEILRGVPSASYRSNAPR